ncbi:MAG: hypothetical protein C0599_18105 [Salinivirgaceae bacterium]|nr:MAG: hypothetical protein C0599_18105 [Salinivirgaceae bacterium]
MRKFTTFLTGIIMLISLANAQNGFENIDIGFEFQKYAIDQSENYWFLTNDVLYKKQGDALLQYTDVNTNMEYTQFKDLIIYDEGLYVITDHNIYDFNFDDPQQCEDLGFNDQITKVFLSNGKLIVFSTPSVPNLKIQIYNEGVWSEADDVPYFATIDGAVDFNGTYYAIIRGEGVFKYDGEDFTLLSEVSLNDLQIWSSVLWGIGSGGVYFLQNEELKPRTAITSINGGLELCVMNGELWTSQVNQLIRIDFDRIQGFKVPKSFTKFPSCLPTQTIVQYAGGSEIITFNPDEYISDPSFSTPENQKFLDVNNVEAAYNIRNSIFWDLSGNAYYKVPKEQDASSIFATSIWFGGKDSEGELHISADRFDQEHVFNAGPLRLADAGTDEVVTDQFNRIWKLDRATIENFKYRYEQGQIEDGTWPIDFNIASWPAHGPEGYAENLAPFIDANNDGVYNPMDGDYPDIEGDQMLYWVMNDVYDGRTPIDNFNESPALGIEIHCKAWANVYEDANSEELEAINNATFLDVEFINRSDTTYTDFYAALCSDADLGYAFDDFIECDVLNHAFFAYNGDDDDDVSGPGYGNYPPAQAFMFLDAPVQYSIPDVDTGIYMSSFMYYQNGGDDVGDPVFASDYYNYMNAKWKDGTDLTFGGNGIDETDVACRYMFPGNSDMTYNIGTGGVEVPDWNIWAMYNNGSTPVDVRGVAANGPYTLEPGQKITYRFAFAWARDEEPSGSFSSYFKLKSIMPYFHQWQRTGEFPSNYNFTIVPVGINPQPASALGVELYPNPASSSVTLKCNAENAIYSIYSLSGKVMKSGRILNNSEMVSLDNINPGLYIVNITDGKVSVTEKLIINF